MFSSLNSLSLPTISLDLRILAVAAAKASASDNAQLLSEDAKASRRITEEPQVTVNTAENVQALGRNHEHKEDSILR